MTTPESFQGRRVPDVADLRLLAEIINQGAVGLPQAAWSAGMSQSEAAARLVTMAERGMPLRLVAEGDRQLLWQIAQAGPVPPVPPVAPVPPVPPAAAGDAWSTAGPETAVRVDDAQSAVWGVPGTADWARSPDEHAAGDQVGGGDVPGQQVGGGDVAGQHVDDGPVRGWDQAHQDAQGAPAARPEPTRRVLISGSPMQPVIGLSGEQLDVSLQQILDPADDILTAVGYRIDAGERALLVQTSIGNRGPADHPSPADLYLEVVDAAGTVLRKAAMSVNGYPAHQVGVPANTLVSGWTVFLVPADTEVSQVRWSIRPDLADRTVSWEFGPAPADPR